MRQNNLISYLPPFLREILEYYTIFDIEDSVFEELISNIENSTKEVIIDKATGYGLVQYEKIFNIANTTSNVEERRFNIKAKMTSQLPFNLEWLDNKLRSIVGDGNYTINLDRTNFSLTIMISHIFPDIVINLKPTLRQEIPANLVLTVNLFKSDNTNTYVGSFVHRGAKRFFAYNN